MEIPSYDLQFGSDPDAGDRNVAGHVLMASFGVTVMLVGQNLLIAIMANTFEEMKRDARLKFDAEQVRAVHFYATNPLLPSELYFLQIPGETIGWCCSAPSGGHHLGADLRTYVSSTVLIKILA